MTAQQLKNAILQEAIEGRLVPQDPNDEPASVLLERIRKEKARLVKEGKLKKKDLEEIPISEDEKPFEIPESWEWVRLKEISSYRRGSFPQPYTDITSYGGPHSMPFVQVADVDEYFYRLKDRTKKTISKKAMPFSVFVPNGTVVVTLQGSIGKVAITQYDSYVDRTLAIFNRIYGQINKMYFSIALKNKFEGESLYARGATIKTITKEEFQNFILPLPPLAEQQRIVAKIEELMPKVEEYGKAQEKLNKLNEELPARLKKSVLQEAIQGRLVPQDPNDEPASVLLEKIREEKKQLVKAGKLKKKDLEEKPISEDEKPFEIPDSWEWVRIKNIFNVCSARRVHEKDWKSSGIPFYRAREIGKLADNGFVDNDLFIDQDLYDEFSKSGVPKEGDLMITAVGTIGKIYIVKKDDIFYYKDGSVLCMENKWQIYPLYAKYAIESPVFIDQYIGESQGTTVATLTMVRVNQYLFPLPPLAEQKRIVAKIEQLLGEINKLNA